jgi:hypothetical protein
MARKDRRTPAGGRLRPLLDAGDHRAARAAAQAVLADAAAGDAERAEASAVLASLAPDRGVVAAGLVAVALAVTLAIWAIVAG